MEIRPSNIIQGKHVKEYVELPYGQFVKIARTHDPLWGYGSQPLKKYKGTVQWEIIQEGNEEIEFEAMNDEHAKIVAREEAKELAESEGWDYFNVCGIKPTA